MKSLHSRYIGVDLTQSVPHLAFASGAHEAENDVPESSPPAALLPVLQGESIIAGPSAHRHRRGVGDVWPPESQVPVNGVYKNGVGRVPLVCAWMKLANLSGHQFSGILGDTEISWNPTGQRRLISSAEEIIGSSVRAWEQKYSAKKTVVVVPDCLGEAAQQALVDKCGSFLIPRPIAVAMSWCRQNADRFLNEDINSSRGIPLGHILVVTLAFDRWEVVPIEIRAMFYKETVWLVPVRNRVGGGGEFPRLGVNFFLAIASKKKSLQHIWGTVFGGTFVSDIVRINADDNDKYSGVKACIKEGFHSTSKSLFFGLEGWKELFPSAPILPPEDFKELLFKNYQNQLALLPDSVQRRCLGVVVDGCCINIPVAENRSLGEFVLSKFEQSKGTSLSSGAEAANGAAITAYALEHGLPSYLETIIPIGIHYHGKNEIGDYENAYKLLVKGKTVSAGEEYKSEEPVCGLNIKQGESKLTLTLRRSEENGKFLFRRVTAEIPKQTIRDEEVQIFAHLKPGQGFAKVFIDSVTRGIFSTRLDWRTMEDCDEPAPPPLAYLPDVSRIVQDELFWENAENYVKEAINEIRIGGDDIANAMDSLRLNAKFNYWPMADAIDEFRGKTPRGDIFRHYGVCPSNGNIENTVNPDLLQELAEESARIFLNKNISVNERNKVQQAISWMYLACPSIIINHARKNLKTRMAIITQEDLHTIGLCFYESEDIELFYRAFEQRLLQGTAGINNWLRACRNIVRFRDGALHPNVVPTKRLQVIVEKILPILEGQIRRTNFKVIFDNCIMLCLYLLKRRRYDEKFLQAESQEFFIIETIFKRLLSKYVNDLNNKQHSIVQVTLKFLRKEASFQDAKTLIEADSDSV